MEHDPTPSARRRTQHLRVPVFADEKALPIGVRLMSSVAVDFLVQGAQPLHPRARRLQPGQFPRDTADWHPVLDAGHVDIAGRGAEVRRQGGLIVHVCGPRCFCVDRDACGLRGLIFFEPRMHCRLSFTCAVRRRVCGRGPVETLRDLLRFHEYRYYVQNDPLISDFEYDTLYKQLEQYEKEHPSSVTPDSPTQRVGKGLIKDFPKVQHLVPMLSLDNSYNADDLLDFDRKARELSGLDSIEYCVEPKFDGASISLIYEHDLLSRGATRGDGEIGDEITPNIKQIRSVPLSAKFSDYGIDQVEIRGEVLMTKNNFKAYNDALMEEGLPPLANPRNAAAGSLRIKDTAEVGRRNLEAFLYHVSYVSTGKKPSVPETHSAMLEMLWNVGFRSPKKEMKVLKGVDAVIGGAFAITSDFSGPVRDELFAAALAGWLAAGRGLAEQALRGGLLGWRAGPELQELLYGLLRALRGEGLRATLAAGGFGGEALAQREQALVAGLPLVPVPKDMAEQAWMREAFHFETAGGLSLSVGAVAAGLSRRRVQASERAEAWGPARLAAAEPSLPRQAAEAVEGRARHRRLRQACPLRK